MKANYLQKNINLLYFISFFHNLLFWLGTWILFYLLFTDYAGIGIIETVMIVTILIFEVPSGALADLLGKKKVLFLAFLIVAIAQFMMAGAINFLMLILSVFLNSVGTTMVSGTFEAITYDTLKDFKKTKQYNKVFSKQTSISYLAMVIATPVGGWLYAHFDPQLPFVAVGVMNLVAMFLVYFLTEPSVDTEKFSWQKYYLQNKQGLQIIFSEKKLQTMLPFLFVSGAIMLIVYEMVGDLLIVSVAKTVEKISMATFFIIFSSMFSVQIAPFLEKMFGLSKSFIGLAFLYVLILFIASVVDFPEIIVIGILLSGIWSVSKVIQSKIINSNTPSKYRATTLSTVNMLIAIPYVCSAVFLGYLADKYTVQKVVIVLAVVMMVGLTFGYLRLFQKNNF